MKKINKYLVGVMAAAFMLTGCDSTLEIDEPSDQLTLDVVYSHPQAIEGAHTGLYVSNFLSNSVFYTYIPAYLSMFSDDFKYRLTSYAEYYSNTYNESTSIMSTIWTRLYKTIRQCNEFIENVEDNDAIDEETRNVYIADALYFRALTNFYLTNMFKNAPLIMTTNADEAATQGCNTQEEIYAQVEADLLEAAAKFGDTDRGVTYFSANACYALLARMYTYTEQWDKAIEYANKLIPVSDGGSGDKYQLEDVDKVYKASSREAIFSANMEGYSGSGTYVGYTREGYLFVPSGNNVNYQLQSNIVNLLAADPDDQRNQWIGVKKGVYYAYKYHNRANQDDAANYEYQNWFRLSEQYLIRAEALANKGDLESAIADVNRLRARAGAAEASADGQSKEDVLAVILDERHKEFFCEMGHRFFDLRRTGKIDEVLGACEWKEWTSSRQWLPIPLTELLNNSNLVQNEGYGD